MVLSVLLAGGLIAGGGSVAGAQVPTVPTVTLPPTPTVPTVTAPVPVPVPAVPTVTSPTPTVPTVTVPSPTVPTVTAPSAPAPRPVPVPSATVPSAPSVRPPTPTPTAPTVATPPGATGLAPSTPSAPAGPAGGSARGGAPSAATSAAAAAGAPAGAVRTGEPPDRVLERLLPASARRKHRRGVSTRVLRREVRRLRGCLPLLSRFERRVLTLRAGLDGRRPLATARVARRLRAKRQRVIDAEHLGLAKLRAADSVDACGALGAAGAPAGTISAAAASTPLAVALAGPALGAPGRDGDGRLLAARGGDDGTPGPIDGSSPSLFVDRLEPSLSPGQLIVAILLLCAGVFALTRLRRRA